MNFFCTKEHYDDWTGRMKLSTDDIFCLDVHEALLVAEMLFDNPMLT
ncbi:MAG: hypothetical protein HGB32_03005 [Geobacteraceae bacterium]|nr:hypothetical protein [Geobacteraceae bacterium]NTW79102.1 hypothetical protein [Geobacteraceae bacterium]